MDWIESLLQGGETPVLTAFVLGLLTAINPCQLATSIAALGFIGRDADDKHRIFISSLLYTVGRALAYTLLAAVLIVIIRSGAETLGVGKKFAEWGEWLLPPLMILGGVLLLCIDKLKHHDHSHDTCERHSRLRGTWGSLVLGALLAMAFCPESALLFFGMLVPMSAAEQGGLLLPIVYAVATSLPVVIVAWLMAYSLSNAEGFLRKMKRMQTWLNTAVGIVFILVGIFYLLHALGLIHAH